MKEIDIVQITEVPLYFNFTNNTKSIYFQIESRTLHYSLFNRNRINNSENDM